VKILFHKLFHRNNYNIFLYDFGKDIESNLYDQQRFYKCSKCEVYTEDFGDVFERQSIYWSHTGVSILRMGEPTHIINYYKEDNKYMKCLKEFMVEELLK